MNEKKRHSDSLEEFYKSTFDSAEMDIPSDFTDSLMENLENRGLSESPKRTLSEKIGANKLYRFLQVSMIFNLITISILGYYVFNSSDELIEVKTPLDTFQIDEKVKSKESSDVREKVVEPKHPLRKYSKNEKSNSPQEIFEDTKKSKKEEILNGSEELNQQVISKVDSVVKETIDTSSVTKEISETVNNTELESQNNQEPVDLDALREKMKDTVDGKPLFK